MPRKAPTIDTRTFKIGNLTISVATRGQFFTWTKQERETVARVVDFLNNEEREAKKQEPTDAAQKDANPATAN